MNNFICNIIPENSYVSYNLNDSITRDKLIRLLPDMYKPYVSYNSNFICGPLMKFIAELSIRFGYRYSLLI